MGKTFLKLRLKLFVTWNYVKCAGPQNGFMWAETCSNGWVSYCNLLYLTAFSWHLCTRNAKRCLILCLLSASRGFEARRKVKTTEFVRHLIQSSVILSSPMAKLYWILAAPMIRPCPIFYYLLQDKGMLFAKGKLIFVPGQDVLQRVPVSQRFVRQDLIPPPEYRI
jgi:hypothetical protein